MRLTDRPENNLSYMKNGLVHNVFESALRRARSERLPLTSGAIRACHIALGELVELTPEAFRAEWVSLARGTPAEHATLHFRRLPAELQCMVCFQKYHPAHAVPACPYCGSVGAKVLSGEECFVESIEAEND